MSRKSTKSSGAFRPVFVVDVSKTGKLSYEFEGFIGDGGKVLLKDMTREELIRGVQHLAHSYAQRREEWEAWATRAGKAKP